MDQRRKVSRWRVVSEGVMVAIGAAFSIGSAVGGEYSSALGTTALFAALA
jgi:hypothetical protein